MSSKRYNNLEKETKVISSEPIDKLLPIIKKNCTTKFDESIDLNLQINNKQKKGEVSLRTIVNMPSGTGKKIKVAVVCEDTKTNEAKESGADIVGGVEFIEKMNDGNLNFEKLICTPGMMVKLSKIGKVLGPKGLMPNPKDGTVTKNIKDAVLNAKKGQAMFRNDKSGIIHCSIGKLSFEDKAIKENFSSLLEQVKKSKPPSAKGIFIKAVTLSSTMGPGIKLNES